jgi:hypothetical protein
MRSSHIAQRAIYETCKLLVRSRLCGHYKDILELLARSGPLQCPRCHPILFIPLLLALVVFYSF